MHNRALATIAALLAGAAVAAPASGNATARIVYGYPYTDRCPGAGLADVVDRWGMYACNCTSYVAWALSANHQRVDWFIRGSMDAWNWPNVARLAQFTIDRTPAAGAVAIWPQLARPFGHLAYVTNVEQNRTIDVAEYNFPGPNGTKTWGFETRSFVRADGALFIHVPRRDDEPHR
jgi:surface antigen